MFLTYYSLNCYILPFFISKDNDQRVDDIISSIKKEKPNIIALQEVWTNSSVKKIKRELRDYSFITGSNSFFNKGGLITGIKKESIEATNKTFAKSPVSSFVESLGGKGYQILTLPNNALFINTHLYAPTSKKSEKFTKEQFEFLCEILRTTGGILAGDLNIEQTDFLTINKLFQYFPTDEYTLHKDNRYANSRLNNTPTSKKIDYCIGTADFYVTEKILQVEHSDHYALVGEILY